MIADPKEGLSTPFIMFWSQESISEFRFAICAHIIEILKYQYYNFIHNLPIIEFLTNPSIIWLNKNLNFVSRISPLWNGIRVWKIQQMKSQNQVDNESLKVFIMLADLLRPASVPSKEEVIEFSFKQDPNY